MDPDDPPRQPTVVTAEMAALFEDMARALEQAAAKGMDVGAILAEFADEPLPRTHRPETDGERNLNSQAAALAAELLRQYARGER